MILGFQTDTFIFIHVALSLIGIVCGLAVLYGLVSSKILGTWTAMFLLSTGLTSITGFMFHPLDFDPAEIVGIISLVALALAIVALYGRRLAGFWRPAYVIGACLALYLNVFVAVVQAFEKIAALKTIAPTQKEPPFLMTQVIVLILFVGAGILAFKRFKQRRSSDK